MNSGRDWIQIFTLLSIIAGLGLVVYELQQTRELTRIHLLAQTSATAASHDVIVAGDDLASSLAKIADPAAELTAEDLYRYDSWVHSYLVAMRLEIFLTQEGLFHHSMLSDDKETRLVLRDHACWYFGHDVGRAYLSKPAATEDELLRLLRELAETCAPEDTYLWQMKSKLPPHRLGDT